jgi:hypothetical protein
MQQKHTVFWIKYLHNVHVWKCALPHEEEKTFASEDVLLDKHMRVEHQELEDAIIRSMAHSSGVPLPRPIDICPICGDEHRPHMRMVEKRDQNDSESDNERDTSSKFASSSLPVDATKPRVHFAELDEIMHKPSGRTVEVTASESTKARLTANARAHRRTERYIGKHIKALTLYFARNLIERVEDEEGSAACDRSLDDLTSTTLMDLQDPPKLPGDENEPISSNLKEDSESGSDSYDPSFMANADDLWAIVRVALGASKPEPVAWRSKWSTPDPTDERHALVLGHDGERHKLVIADNEVVDGKIAISTLQAAAASKLGINDPNRISMFFEGRTLEGGDETARHIGFEAAEVWKEVVCVVDHVPPNMRTRLYNEAHKDQAVINSNFIRCRRSLTLNAIDFDDKVFWEDGWLQQIFLHYPRVHLREDTEVWPGIEPTTAFAVAADT